MNYLTQVFYYLFVHCINFGNKQHNPFFPFFCHTKFYTGMDGQYLSSKKCERPSNDVIMDVFEDFMDLDNFPEVKRAMKFRLFGLNPCADDQAVDIVYNWMKLDKVELEQQNKVFEPVLALIRKLCFDHDKYSENVIVRKKKFEFDFDNNETFAAKMDEVLNHLGDKRNVYYKNIKENKDKRLKEKYSENGTVDLNHNHNIKV